MRETAIPMAAAIFEGAEGHGALPLSRDLDRQDKTAFVPSHTLREAIAADVAGHRAPGEVEIDGARFGGHVRPANHRDDRVDRRKTVDPLGKRRVVVVVPERSGRTITTVSRTADTSGATIT